MDNYSGVLKDFRCDIRIAVFPNTYKEKDNQPDMNIVISFTNGKSESDEEQDEESPGNPPKGKRRKKTKENEDDNGAPF